MRYSEVLEGISMGLVSGIGTESDVLDHVINKIDHDVYTTEFYIGFGIGVEQSQQLRDKLSEEPPAYFVKSKILLGSIELYRFKFLDEIKVLTDNIDKWFISQLPEHILYDIAPLLKANRHYNALISIDKFYRNHYNLKPLLEVNMFIKRYSSLRHLKKMDLYRNVNIILKDSD